MTWSSRLLVACLTLVPVAAMAQAGYIYGPSETPAYASYASLPASAADGAQAITSDSGRVYEWVGTRGGVALDVWVPEPWGALVVGPVDGTSGPCVIDLPGGDTAASLTAAGWTDDTGGSGSVVETAGQYLTFTGTNTSTSRAIYTCYVTTMPASTLALVQVEVVGANGGECAALYRFDGTRQVAMSASFTSTAHYASLINGASTAKGIGYVQGAANDVLFVRMSSAGDQKLMNVSQVYPVAPWETSYTTFSTSAFGPAFRWYASGSASCINRVKRLILMELSS